MKAVENQPEKCEVVVGMALFFPCYSTWQGTCCYLEDLIVSESYRGRGVGDSLVHAVGNVCLLTDMPRLSWQCLKWNEKALTFYGSLGAVTRPEWTDLRMDKNAMKITFGDLACVSCEMHTVSDPVVKQVVVPRTTNSWSTAFAAASEVIIFACEYSSPFLILSPF